VTVDSGVECVSGGMPTPSGRGVSRERGPPNPFAGSRVGRTPAKHKIALTLNERVRLLAAERQSVEVRVLTRTAIDR